MGSASRRRYHAHVVARPSSALAEALALVASGRPLRDGLERVLQAKRGALVVVGDNAAVLSICTGGFLLDAEFSPQRLSELAKMDGAIILSARAERIARANVHLGPSPSIPTNETGTRHRTAERVARSIDVPVVSVSAAMSMITVYRGSERYLLQASGRLNEAISQALQALQRFRSRFDAAIATLSALEVEDTVTVRDVAAALQPSEFVMRIAEEIEGKLLELGEDGRLQRLQLQELVEAVEPIRHLLVRDYLCDGQEGGGVARFERKPRHHPDAVLQALASLSNEELADFRRVAGALGLALGQDELDESIEARGYRMLHRLPRFPETVADRIVEHFGGLARIMRATVRDLEEVGGVGESRARSVKEGLSRLAEASILDRYS